MMSEASEMDEAMGEYDDEVEEDERDRDWSKRWGRRRGRSRNTVMTSDEYPLYLQNVDEKP